MFQTTRGCTKRRNDCVMYVAQDACHERPRAAVVAAGIGSCDNFAPVTTKRSSSSSGCGSRPGVLGALGQRYTFRPPSLPLLPLNHRVRRLQRNGFTCSICMTMLQTPYFEITVMLTGCIETVSISKGFRCACDSVFENKSSIAFGTSRSPPKVTASTTAAARFSLHRGLGLCQVC